MRVLPNAWNAYKGENIRNYQHAVQISLGLNSQLRYVAVQPVPFLHTHLRMSACTPICWYYHALITSSQNKLTCSAVRKAKVSLAADFLTLGANAQAKAHTHIRTLVDQHENIYNIFRHLGRKCCVRPRYLLYCGLSVYIICSIRGGDGAVFNFFFFFANWNL